MNKLMLLVDAFWHWTGIPKEDWWNVDINDLPIDAAHFEQLGEMCNACIKLVNCSLTDKDTEYFLMGMAINSEDEDILDFMKEYATDTFLYDVISTGVSYPQADARWQLAELLRRDIRERECFLHILSNDPDEYVRKRAENILREIPRNKLT
jgi:hypothetical protein